MDGLGREKIALIRARADGEEHGGDVARDPAPSGACRSARG